MGVAARRRLVTVAALLAALGSSPAYAGGLLLAAEVRQEGDAEGWRWWCAEAPDPLAAAALEAVVAGASRAGADLIAGAAAGAVHPAFCAAPLDGAMGDNLAGLLGASGLLRGTLSLGTVTAHDEPSVHRLAVRWQPDDAAATGRLEITGFAPSDRPLLDAVRAAGRRLGAALIHGRQGVGTAPRADAPALWIRVDGPVTADGETQAADRLDALLPDGYGAFAMGAVGPSAAIVVRGPADAGVSAADLRALVIARIAKVARNPPFEIAAGAPDDDSLRLRSTEIDELHLLERSPTNTHPAPR